MEVAWGLHAGDGTVKHLKKQGLRGYGKSQGSSMEAAGIAEMMPMQRSENIFDDPIIK